MWETKEGIGGFNQWSEGREECVEGEQRYQEGIWIEDVHSEVGIWKGYGLNQDVDW